MVNSFVKKRGNVASLQDNFSHYAYAYDAVNRVTSIDNTGTPGSPRVTLSYGYDKNGNRTSLGDSLGGTDSYAYDARDQLDLVSQTGTNSSGVAPELVFFNHDQAGNLTSQARYADIAANSQVATTSYVYDAANRLTSLAHTKSGGAAIASYGYTLDAANRLTSEAHAWNGGNSTDTITYGYTNNEQLTAVNHSNSAFANESFSYDTNGNRNASGQTTSTGNQIQSDGTSNSTYDAAGNLATKTTIATGVKTVYQRDYRNRLAEVDRVAGGTTTVVARFTYDALNRQIAEVDNPNSSATTRRTVYDGQTPLLDFNGSGHLTARYLSIPGAIDELLARQTASGVAWYLDDRLGSVREIVDNSGAVIDHVDYGAFGNVTAESSPSAGDRFKYAGMELDVATGLGYDRARYYDPTSGKFVGQDPIGFASGTSNLYEYAQNNPLNSLDLTGLAAGVLRLGDQGAPTIGDILDNSTVEQQLYWFWKRASANRGREEGGWVLYNTCSGKFTLTVDGMTQTGAGSRAQGKIYRNGPPSSITPYYTTGKPSNQPTNPSSGPPPGFPVTGPPAPTGSCWFVVAAWHTHPGGLGRLSPRGPDGPGDYGPIDSPGIPVIIRYGRGPKDVVHAVP